MYISECHILRDVIWSPVDYAYGTSFIIIIIIIVIIKKR